MVRTCRRGASAKNLIFMAAELVYFLIDVRESTGVRFGIGMGIDAVQPQRP